MSPNLSLIGLLDRCLMYVSIVLLDFGLACVREECQLVKNFDINVYMEGSLRVHVVSSRHSLLQFLGMCS